jgi:hypothetical protein
VSSGPGVANLMMGMMVPVVQTQPFAIDLKPRSSRLRQSLPRTKRKLPAVRLPAGTGGFVSWFADGLGCALNGSDDQETSPHLGDPGGFLAEWNGNSQKRSHSRKEMLMTAIAIPNCFNMTLSMVRF